MGARDDTLALFATKQLDRHGPDSSAPDGRRNRFGIVLRDGSILIREWLGLAVEGN